MKRTGWHARISIRNNLAFIIATTATVPVHVIVAPMLILHGVRLERAQ
jgi:hypothetical protein